MDDELERLREMEKDFEAVVDLCPASGWAISDFDLPQISGGFD